VLKGRLGLETARVPHVDRHGLIWLSYGNLGVEDGTLRFVAAKSPWMDAGDYAIPFQTVSMVLLGPGTTVSHDALRLLARHGTALAAVGEDGVRQYTAPPLGSGESALARRQVELWADRSGARIDTARRLYAWRLGEVLPHTQIEVLRGIEGARMKESYALLARKHGVVWNGRLYDRADPNAADLPNQAINHAATAMEAAACIAVSATGTLPQLGFIHEDASIAFCLDIADLYRTELTLPIAFEGVKLCEKRPDVPLERHVRKLAGHRFRQTELIARMIDRVKTLFEQP
jgi:CRISPR-associated protein Cas1